MAAVQIGGSRTREPEIPIRHWSKLNRSAPGTEPENMISKGLIGVPVLLYGTVEKQEELDRPNINYPNRER